MSTFIGELIRKSPDGDVYQVTPDGLALVAGSTIKEGGHTYQRAVGKLGSDPDAIFIQQPEIAAPIATGQETPPEKTTEKNWPPTATSYPHREVKPEHEAKTEHHHASEPQQHNKGKR